MVTRPKTPSVTLAYAEDKVVTLLCMAANLDVMTMRQ